MSVVRYRKRPVEVDTIQWTGTNVDELIDFTGGDFLLPDRCEQIFSPEFTAKVYDSIHDTWVRMKTGQHVVRGIRGELYPIAEDVLAETYERVGEEATAEAATATPDFFEAGHTYLYTRLRWRFRCDAVTSHPDTGKRVAVGYSNFGQSSDGKWQTGDMSQGIWDEGGWDDVTEAGDGS